MKKSVIFVISFTAFCVFYVIVYCMTNDSMINKINEALFFLLIDLLVSTVVIGKAVYRRLKEYDRLYQSKDSLTEELWAKVKELKTKTEELENLRNENDCFFTTLNVQLLRTRDIVGETYEERVKNLVDEYLKPMPIDPFRSLVESELVRAGRSAKGIQQDPFHELTSLIDTYLANKNDLEKRRVKEMEPDKETENTDPYICPLQPTPEQTPPLVDNPYKDVSRPVQNTPRIRTSKQFLSWFTKNPKTT